jgi:hypothetical protein
MRGVVGLMRPLACSSYASAIIRVSYQDGLAA